MYKPQNFTPRETIKKRTARCKTAVMLVCLILTIFIGIGATVAFVLTHTDSVENTFVPAEVSCTVLEGADGNTFDGITKQDVRIKNTGKTDAYIRVAVVVNWVADADNSVYAACPQEDVDYSIAFNPTNWLQGANGFWYYTSPVAIEGTTADLIKECKAVAGKAPEGFHLSVEIVASAIQSSPDTVVEEHWGVTVKDGMIVSVPAEN